MAQHRHGGTVGAHQTSVQLPLFPPLATPAVKHFHLSCIPRGQTASGLRSVANNPKLLFNFWGRSRESFHAELAQGGYLNSRGAFQSKGGSAVKGRGRKLGSGVGLPAGTESRGGSALFCPKDLSFLGAAIEMQQFGPAAVLTKSNFHPPCGTSARRGEGIGVPGGAAFGCLGLNRVPPGQAFLGWPDPASLRWGAANSMRGAGAQLGCA